MLHANHQLSADVAVYACLASHAPACVCQFVCLESPRLEAPRPRLRPDPGKVVLVRKRISSSYCEFALMRF
jgi:hypothetical protein